MEKGKRKWDRREEKEGNKLPETEKDFFIGRKTLGDQLHQSVQTEERSFSLSCYLATSHSPFGLETGCRRKKKKLTPFESDQRSQGSKLDLIHCVQLTLKPRLNTSRHWVQLTFETST